MAANNEEKISSFIDLTATGKEYDTFLAQLQNLLALFQKINNTKIKIEGSQTFAETAAAVKKLKTEEDELSKIQAQISSTYKKRIALETEQAKILAQEKELLRQRNAELKTQVKEDNAAEGSIEKYRAALIRLNKEYDNLSAVERNASQGQALKNQIAAISAELKDLEGETGRFQRNVGNYSSGFKSALTVLENELKNVKNQLSDPSLQGKQLDSLIKQESLLSEVLEGVSTNFSSTRAEARAFQEAAQKIGITLGQQSELFQSFRQEVGAGVDDINDIKQSIKLAASDTQGFDKLIGAAQGLTGAFSVAQGVTALFGQDNEELQKTFVKLQAAMTILNGLQAIQNELKNKDSILRKVVGFLIKTETKLTEEQAAAQEASAVATNTATAATTRFGFALKALTIGTILILIPLLVAGFSKLAAAGSSLNDILKRNKEITPEVADALKAMGDNIGDIANGVIDDLNNDISKLNDELGNTPGSIEKANAALIVLEDRLKFLQKSNDFFNIDLSAEGLSRSVNKIASTFGIAEDELTTNLKQQETIRAGIRKKNSLTYEKDLEDATKKAQEEEKKKNDDLIAKNKQAGEKAAADAKEALEKQLQAAFDLKQLYAQRGANTFKEIGDNENLDYRQRIVALSQFAEEQKKIIQDRVDFEIKSNKQTGSVAKVTKEKGVDDQTEVVRSVQTAITKIYEDEAKKRQAAEKETQDKAAADNQNELDEIKKQGDAENDIIDAQIKEKNKLNEKAHEQELENENKLADAKKQLYQEVFNFSQAVVNGIFEGQKNRVQSQIDDIDRQKEAAIAAANAEATSVQEKEDKIAVINLTAQAKKEALERRQKEIAEKQAKFAKAFQIAQIIGNTAEAVIGALAPPPVGAGPIAGIPLAIIIGAIGAAQLATVLATPIPKYKTGRQGGPAEAAIVGDGGIKEVIEHKDGTAYKTPDKPTITFLPEGASVYPSVSDYVDKYSQRAARLNMRNASNSTFVNIQSNEDLKADLQGIKRAIETKAVTQITNTYWGLHAQTKSVEGDRIYLDKYLRT